jgi:hypothetical protein
MNDDLDVLRRLVDYHDHIAAPAVLVADDLNRGRRRVRRNRGLVAGGVALGLASVAAVVSLVTGGDPAASPQPVGPGPTSTWTPTPGNPGLDAPMIAPGSILELQRLGFRAEEIVTLGATLKPDREELEVVVENSTFAVEVFYQGKGPGLLPLDRPQRPVSINGVAGTYVERFDGNSYLKYVIWEYAPNSWAAVRRSDDVDLPDRKAQVLAIAESLRPGGENLVVPFRVGTASVPLLRAEILAEVGIPRTREFWRAAFTSGLGIVGGMPTSNGSSCDPPSETSGRFFQAFTYRGFSGCLQGSTDKPSEVGAVVLEGGPTARMVHRSGAPLDGYDLEDLKQLLAEITEAPTADRSTWYELGTAFGS